MGEDWGSRLWASGTPPEGLVLSRAKCRSDSRCHSLGFSVSGFMV